MQLQLSNNQLYLPDYENEKSKSTSWNKVKLGRCTDFITTFTDPKLKNDSIHGKNKYMIEMVIKLEFTHFFSKKLPIKRPNLFQLSLMISESSSAQLETLTSLNE